MHTLWIETELNTLRALIVIIDDHLSNICEKSLEVDDPDSFGLFDSAEHLTGLGFVACQTYMATVYGNLNIEKQLALNMGSKHRGGRTKAQIINHAANYWKHNNEWVLDKSATRRKAIESAFESVGFSVGTDYPLCGVLTELSAPFEASFRSVIDMLELWKTELVRTA